MEYLFPILFIAIIFAIRVMNKKLQENQKTENSFPPVSPSTPILNDKSMKKQNSRFTTSESIHSEPRKKEKASPDSLLEKSDSPLQPEESQESPFTLRNAEDARKAFIYSEIINRKY